MKMTEHVDIYPTLCRLCDIQVPQFVEGSDLAHLMYDPEGPWKRAAFSSYRRDRLTGRSLRTERFRFTRWLSLQGTGEGKTVQTELYDYQADPLETRNVASDPGYRGILTELNDLMDGGWRVERNRLDIKLSNR
jgi:uncharacterized sulfatase